MFYDTGCHGRIEVGELPAEVQRRLAALPGEWLEFDPDAEAIVVRHIQPTSAPSLPTIAGELVRIVSEIPGAHHAAIRGGDLFVHTERTTQLVRLRVEPGGAVHVRWAHPDYAAAQKRPYAKGSETLVDPRVQRLNGQVRLTAAEPASAGRELEAIADTYEGLYPEGECRVATDAAGTVQLDLTDVNLDAELLVQQLERTARPGSLAGRREISSFADEAPERYACFVFESGRTYIQRPVLWDSET
jgi:hypothetical protein